MKLTIPTEHLRDILSAVKPAVSTRTTLPILSCVRLTATDCLTASATTLDLWIDAADGANVEEKGAACVNFHRLDKALQAVTGEATQIEVKASKLTLKCGRAVFHLPTLGAEDYPNPPSDGFCTPIPFTHHKYFRRMTPFASVEPARYTLNGVYLGDEAIVAVDGKKLMAIEYPHKLNLIVPTDTANAVGGMEAEEITLRHGNNLVQFSDGRVTVTSKVIEGNYPAWKQVVPDGQNIHITLKREELLTACRSASVMMKEEKFDSLRLNFTKGECRVSLSTNEIGDGEESVDCDAQKDFTISFAPAFILPLLRSAEGETITLGFIDEMSPMVARENGTTLVTMPNRTA